MAENSGKLFKNPRFTEGSKLPRYIGECEVDGVKKTVAAWIRKSKSGVSYMYISFDKFKGVAKSKVVPIQSNNTNGLRKVEKIATGKKETKVKPADMELTGLPF